MVLAANLRGDADLQELEMLLAEAVYPCCFPPPSAESLGVLQDKRKWPEVATGQV